MLQYRFFLYVGQTELFELRMLEHVMSNITKPYEPGAESLYRFTFNALLENLDVLFEGQGDALQGFELPMGLDDLRQRYDGWIAEGNARFGCNTSVFFPFVRLAAVIGLPPGTSEDDRKKVEKTISDLAIKEFGDNVYGVKKNPKLPA